RPSQDCARAIRDRSRAREARRPRRALCVASRQHRHCGRRFASRPLGDIPNVAKRTDPGGLRHHAAAWLGWWILCEILWLLFTSTVSISENIVGFGSSAIAATAAEIVRANRPFVFRARLRWLRPSWRIPIQIAKDTWTVFVVLALHVTGRKRVRGTWQAVPFR